MVLLNGMADIGQEQNYLSWLILLRHLILFRVVESIRGFSIKSIVLVNKTSKFEKSCNLDIMIFLS